MQKIIIHGGCGAREDKNTSFGDYHQHLLPIIQKAYNYLKDIDDANEAAVFAANFLRMMRYLMPVQVQGYSKMDKSECRHL